MFLGDHKAENNVGLVETLEKNYSEIRTSLKVQTLILIDLKRTHDGRLYLREDTLKLFNITVANLKKNLLTSKGFYSFLYNLSINTDKS